MGDWVILSFDIGIKNLAYCMLGWDPEKNRYEIIDWKLVNIVPDLDKQFCVGVTVKKKKICGRVARFTSKVQNQTYCSIHAKPKEEMTPIKKRKVAKISNQEINTLLVKKLDEIPSLLNCDEVILEHQPAKNPRMKNLSFMLYSYFIIRGFVDKPDTRCKEIRFRQINSDKKLSLYTGPNISCHLKDKYSRNKFYSKKYCEYMIQADHDQKWLDFYNSCKKKDDLADSYLQGAWYLTQRFNSKKTKNKLQSSKACKEVIITCDGVIVKESRDSLDKLQVPEAMEVSKPGNPGVPGILEVPKSHVDSVDSVDSVESVKKGDKNMDALNYIREIKKIDQDFK